MCQQTRVDTVVPYYERFMAAWPTVVELAAAPEEEVLGMWAGLGYYRRCRSLQAGAREVVSRFGGEIPPNVEDLRSLPGIGPYTAGAIASMAFGVPAAAVDGNVSRVLSRWLALEEPVDGSRGQRILWETAHRLVDPEDPSTHNQALMELGALVCSPTQPACDRCPVTEHCAAFSAGRQVEFPRKSPKRSPVPITGVAALIRDDAGRPLLASRPVDGLLGGLWELPGGEMKAGEDHEVALKARLQERLGLEIDVREHLGSVQHVFTHRRLTLHLYDARDRGASPRPLWYTASRWLEPDGLNDVPLSTLSRKVLTTLGYDVE